MKKRNSLLCYSRALRICSAPFDALFAVTATAANISWNGATDALWSTGGNWVGGVAPVAADVAVFDVGSNANLTTALGADFSIAGLRITSPGGLITIGAGNLLTLGAGGIDMSAASQNLLLNALVALAADQSWNVTAGRTLTANGIISGTNVNLNKIGLGDLILGGANTFTGTTTIGGGTLTLNGSLNGTTGTDLTFAGTGIFNVSAASGVSQGMKVLRFNSGEGTVRSTNNGGTSTVSFTSRAARTAGATGNFVISGGTAGTPGSPGTLGTNNITIGGELTGQLLDRGLFYNGSQYAAYDAGGFIRGLNYGTDTNAPASIPTGSTLGVNDGTKNVEISGDITAQTTASVNTIRIPGGFTITLAGGRTLSFNGILKSGGSAATISEGAGITTTAANTEMVFRTDLASDSLTILTPIIANGTSSLTKSGEGTLILSGANRYTGGTTINAGTVQAGSTTAFGGATGVEGALNFGGGSTGVVRLFGQNNTIAGLNTNAVAGTPVVENGFAGDVTLTVNNSAASNYAGILRNGAAGTFFLNKSGAGMLTLSGMSSYSGATTINAGIVSISASSNLGDDSATNTLFLNNATLQDTGLTTSSRGVIVTNGANIDVVAGARLTLAGNVSTPQAASDMNFVKKGLGVLNFNGGTIFSDIGALPNRIINITQGSVNFTNATLYLSSLITQTNNNAYVTATNSSININDAVNNWYHGGLRVGHGNGNYSYLMKGGSLTLNDFGNGILIQLGGNTGKAVMTVDGGAMIHTGGIEMADTDNTYGVFNVRNANITNTWKLRVGTSKGIGVVNMLGGILDNNADEISLQYRMGQANCWGIVNLNGGVMKTTQITSGDGTTGFTGNRSYINFHGGTLSPAASSTNFVFSSLTGANAGLVSAPQLMVYSEGAVLDVDTGKDITIGVPLQAPSGNGVVGTTIALSGASQGSGYRGEPVVKIELTPGGLANVTATAVANMVDDGTGNGTFKIASITITNPGVNFAATPTVNIYGGDPTTAAVIPALTIAPNVSGGLSKLGPGTLTLSAANTYTGATTISGGTLQIGAGGTKGSITATSNVVNNGVLTFNRTDNYGGDFTQVISGNGSLALSNGVLTLTGENTYGGGTTVSAGVLKIGNGGTTGNIGGGSVTNNSSLIFNRSNELTVSGVIGGAGTLTKLGAGTLVLNGANTYSGETLVSEGTLVVAGTPSASGGMTVSGGTLKLDYVTSNVTKIADAALLTLRNGTLELAGGSHVEIVGSTMIADGASNVTRSSGTSVLRMNALARSAGGTVNFSAENIASTTTPNDVSGVLGAWATVGGTDLAVNSGVLEGGGNSFIRAYTGYTDIAARGAVVPGGLTSNVRINSAGSGGSDVLSTPTTVINTLMQNTATASTVALAGGTLRANGILLSLSGESFTIGSAVSDGTLTSAASSGSPDVALSNNSASKALTINTVIADNTVPSTLTKFGVGTAILTAANTYTGSTAVSVGVLQVGNGGASGSLGIGSVINDASLAFNRSDSPVVSNPISGSGSLSQNGGGMLTLTGSNTYTGVTNINSGVLQIGNGGTTGSLGAGGVSNIASLIFNRSDLTTFNGIISGSGQVAQNGSGTLVLSGVNTYSGATTINAGTLSIASNANLGSVATAAPLSINGGTLLTTATFTMDNAGSNQRGIILDARGGTFSNSAATQLTITGVVSGNGKLTKSGAGTLVLGGANTFIGSTTVNGGTLKLDYATNNVTKLADGSALTMSGGTLEIANGSHVEVVGSTTIAAGSSTVTRTGGTSVLRMNAITKNAGGVLNFTAGNIASTSTPNEASGILGIWATVGGTDWATNSGVAEGGGNSFITAYTGYTNIAALGATVSTAGNVRINSAGSGGSNVLGAPTTLLNTLMQNTGTASTLTLAGGTLRVNGIVINPAGEALTIGSAGNDGVMTSATSLGAPDVTLINNSASKTLTINSQIADNTVASSLSKSGAGIVMLAGANTYTGGTTNGVGILQVGNGGASGSLGSGNVSNEGSLIFNRSGTLTVPGVISGSGPLAQSGPGTVVLSAPNTYTGSTTLNAGTLSIGADVNLGNSSGLIFNSGTLQITGTALTSYAGGVIGTHAVTLTAGKSVSFDISDAGNVFTVSQTLSQGSGGFTKSGAGKLVLSGANTFTGATTLSGGVLSVGTDANLGNGNALIFDGGTLQITGTVLNSYAAGVIGTHAVTLVPNKSVGLDIVSLGNTFTIVQILNQGTGGFTKFGAGTLILNGANSYTGLTTLSEGTTVVTGTISGSTVVNSGSTLAVNNSAGTMGGVTMKSGGIFSPGVNGIGEASIGTLALEAGSVFQFQINTADSQIDLVTITGDLNIENGAILNASDLASVALTTGSNVPAILDYSGAWNGGTFAGLPDDSVFTIGLNVYQISYNGVDGASSEVTLTVVPEPGAAVSLLGGLGVLLGARRRRA